MRRVRVGRGGEGAGGVAEIEVGGGGLRTPEGLEGGGRRGVGGWRFGLAPAHLATDRAVEDAHGGGRSNGVPVHAPAACRPVQARAAIVVATLAAQHTLGACAPRVWAPFVDLLVALNLLRVRVRKQLTAARPVSAAVAPQAHGAPEQAAAVALLTRAIDVLQPCQTPIIHMWRGRGWRQVGRGKRWFDLGE